MLSVLIKKISEHGRVPIHLNVLDLLSYIRNCYDFMLSVFIKKKNN